MSNSRYRLEFWYILFGELRQGYPVLSIYQNITSLPINRYDYDDTTKLLLDFYNGCFRKLVSCAFYLKACEVFLSLPHWSRPHYVCWVFSKKQFLKSNWNLQLIGPRTAVSPLEITSWAAWNETCHAQQSCWLPVTSGNSHGIEPVWQTGRLWNASNQENVLSLPSLELQQWWRWRVSPMA